MSKKDKREIEFKNDHLESNPKLHILYVNWAIEHLTAIDNFLERLHYFSNNNLTDVICAVIEQKEKLCKDNRAYFDAKNIINIINRENMKTKFNAENEWDKEE